MGGANYDSPNRLDFSIRCDRMRINYQFTYVVVLRTHRLFNRCRVCWSARFVHRHVAGTTVKCTCMHYFVQFKAMDAQHFICVALCVRTYQLVVFLLRSRDNRTVLPQCS